MRNKEIYDLFNNCGVLNDFPFPIDDFDSITQYEMLIRCLKSIKKQLGINSDLYKKITDLENYLNNLDLQDEVNKKIDEMYQNGQLQEIITEYLQINGILAFNTLSDLKSATNLINGSKVKTLGYHSYNDGGGALYLVREVTNQDVENDGDIVALYDKNLIAELVEEKEITFVMFGAYGDNVNDDTTSIKNALSYAKNKCNINLLNKNYKIIEEITIENTNLLNGTISTSSYINLKNKIQLKNIKVISTLYEATIKLIDTENLLIKDCEITGGILCRTHANNTKILNTIFKGHGYHILFDDMFNRTYTDSIGKTFIVENCEFIIDNNNYWGDIIEINTPNYSFNNVYISNCYAHLGTNVNNPVQYSTPQIGFGFANVKNIVIDNNILDSVSAGNGVLHFEICEDVNVTNNQIINNKDVQYSTTFNALEITVTNKCNISNNIITGYPIGIFMLNDDNTNQNFIIDSNYFNCYRYGIYGNKLSDFTISNNRFNMAVKNATITNELQCISVYEYGGVVGLQNSNICNNYFYLPTNQLDNSHYTYALNLGESSNLVINSNYSRGVGKSRPAGTFTGSGYKTATSANGQANLVITDNTPVGYMDGSDKSIVIDTNNHKIYKYVNGAWVAGCVVYDTDMTDFEQTSVVTVAAKIIKKDGVKAFLINSTTSTNFTANQEYTLMTISDAKARPSYRVRTVVTTLSNNHFIIDIDTDGVVKITPLENISSGANIRCFLSFI